VRPGVAGEASPDRGDGSILASPGVRSENLSVATQRPTLDEVKARRDEIVRIAAQHGTSNVRVFGSVARGTADEESDVDLLIDFVDPAPEDFGYYGILYEVQEAVQRLLGRAVHVVHLENPTSPRARRILRDAVAL
jgi:predicted nucleotidyltransferase